MTTSRLSKSIISFDFTVKFCSIYKAECIICKYDVRCDGEWLNTPADVHVMN